MNHPDTIYSRDLNNNCIILKWGESGYYRTDYPEGKYTDEIIDEINSRMFDGDIEMAHKVRNAMECCSIAAQNNSNIDWESHYKMCLAI